MLELDTELLVLLHTHTNAYSARTRTHTMYISIGKEQVNPVDTLRTSERKRESARAREGERESESERESAHYLAVYTTSIFLEFFS